MALGAIGAAGVVSAVLSALFAALAVIVAHADGNPPLAGDLVTSGWIAALTAAAYTGWFSLGATFGLARGLALEVPLVLDFVLGAGTGLAAAFLPRAHAASLLGGAGPLGLPQSSSSLVLAASAMALSGLAAALSPSERCRRPGGPATPAQGRSARSRGAAPHRNPRHRLLQSCAAFDSSWWARSAPNGTRARRPSRAATLQSSEDRHSALRRRGGSRRPPRAPSPGAARVLAGSRSWRRSWRAIPAARRACCQDQTTVPW